MPPTSHWRGAAIALTAAAGGADRKLRAAACGGAGRAAPRT